MGERKQKLRERNYRPVESGIGSGSAKRNIKMNFYKLSLYGLALAFMAFEAGAAASVRGSPSGRISSASVRASSSSSSLGRSSLSSARMASSQSARSATTGTTAGATRVSSAARALPKHVGAVGTSSGFAGGADVSGLYSAIDDLEKRKADKDDVYTKDQADKVIFDAIAEIDGTGGGADVSGKADKVAGSVSGNLAGLGADGNLTDSGLKASDVLTVGDIGAVAGRVVAVGPDGKIDPGLYEKGTGGADIPDSPADGNEYALLATSTGTKIWVRVRNEYASK